MMLISKELERRMFLLADPETRWVQRIPYAKESCLVFYISSYGVSWSLSPKTLDWLNDFIEEIYCDESVLDASEFNDKFAKSREEVIWMLEEAIDLAKDLGL